MPIRVAILEDDPSQRARLSAAVSASPRHVLAGQFATLAELRRCAPAIQCDVALVDIQLPDGSGIDSIRLFKSLSCNPRVLVITVLNDSAALFNALRAGADGYLLKTGEPKVLLERLDELLTGQAPMSPAIAQRLLAHFRTRPGVAKSAEADLTSAETDVLKLLAQGHSNKEIAEARKTTVPTIRTQLASIYQKLQVRSRTEAVSWFHKR